MLRAALAGLADEPVRVLATTNRAASRSATLAVPPNARVVDWLSYTRTMPHCAAVVCHAGHGTVVRALARRAAGGVPGRGRHGRERGARGVGGRRRVAAAAARDRARGQAGGAAAAGRPSYATRARELADWAESQRRRGACGGGPGGKAPGVGLEPTTLSVNSRIALPIELPRTAYPGHAFPAIALGRRARAARARGVPADLGAVARATSRRSACGSSRRPSTRSSPPASTR